MLKQLQIKLFQCLLIQLQSIDNIILLQCRLIILFLDLATTLFLIRLEKANAPGFLFFPLCLTFSNISQKVLIAQKYVSNEWYNIAVR